jgi:hypothetical protein
MSVFSETENIFLDMSRDGSVGVATGYGLDGWGNGGGFYFIIGGVGLSP